tara:strand:- start:762 stop:896 length:135 start_codon:yes stop_codon:yes gene_type:complete
MPLIVVIRGRATTKKTKKNKKHNFMIFIFNILLSIVFLGAAIFE